MSGALVVANQPSSLEAVEDQCLMVETWAESCDSIPQLRDASNKLAAIAEYLDLTSTEGRARVAAAQRRLEVRIGQLLGPTTTGERHDLEPSVATEGSDGLTRHQRHDFRAMAADPETVEDVIATSTDDNPASRRQVTEAIKAKKEPNVPVSLDKSREAVAARVAKAKEMAAAGYRSAQIADALGLARDSFVDFRQRHGVEVPADKTIGKSRRLDVDRILSESVSTLEGVSFGLDLIGDPNLAGLDPEQIEGWAESMTQSLRTINKFHKQLREMMK